MNVNIPLHMALIAVAALIFSGWLLCLFTFLVGAMLEPEKRVIRGTVTESGGGLVTVIVDRDTENYPAEGSTVKLEASW